MNERSRIRRSPLPLLLAGLLPLAAQAAEPATSGIQKEISAELAEARKEMRAELAAARIELQTGNLEVGNSMRFGKSGKRSADQESLPKAEITPRGDFLIAGKAVAIDPHQRQELLAYRGQVIDIALAGIDIGERSAQAALEAVDRGLFSLMLSAMTGSLERNLERTLKASIEPGVRQLCDSLPPLLASQQRLSASVPEFRPYATLEKDDVDGCADEIRREFAQN
jgi:ribosomal protein L29